MLMFNKSTNFMRQLMEDESNHCADSERETLRDGCAQSQTISKVVDGITENDDPGYWLKLEYSTPSIIWFLIW